MEYLSIGEVARRTGVSVETIRYYEREALIHEPPRSTAGYRRYPTETVRRIRFIKRAKALGFTLGEVAELLSLQTAPGASCADVKARAQVKIADIDERLRMFERMKQALVQLVGQCHGHGPVSECPILESLDPEEALSSDGR